MPDTGATYPGTGANEDRADSPAWSNPTNIERELLAATWSGTDQPSDWLRGSDFGFSVPTDAVIVGIKLDMSRTKISGAVSNSLLYLVDENGTNIGGSKHATNQEWVGAQEVSYGGASDLWGATLTPAIVNSSNFGARLSVVCAGASSCSVTWYKITVYYVIKPTTTILPASLITSTTARKNAQVANDGGAVCEGRFSWGKIEKEDDFEWGEDGDDIDTSGGGITWTKVAEGTSTAKITTDQKVSGTRSLELYRDGTNNPSALTTQAAVTGGIAFYARHDGAGRWTLSWGDGTHRIYPFVHSNWNLVYNNAAGSVVDTGKALVANTQYLIKLKNIDWANGTFDMDVDGVPVVVAGEMWDSAVDSGTIRLRSLAGTDAYVFIDDVRILSNRTTTDWDGGSYSTNDPFYSDLNSLDPATKYVYEAQLKNIAGEGPWSADMTFLTLVAGETYDETGRLQIILGVQTKSDIATRIETAKTQVVLTPQGRADLAAFTELGKLQAILAPQGKSDIKLLPELGREQVIAAIQGSADSTTLSEVSKEQIIAAISGKTDASILNELAKLQTVFAIQGRSDSATFNELDKEQILLVTQGKVVGFRFLELGKEQIALVVTGESDAAILSELAKLQVLLALHGSLDQALFSEQLLQIILATQGRTDVYIPVVVILYDETGRVQIILATVGSEIIQIISRIAKPSAVHDLGKTKPHYTLGKPQVDYTLGKTKVGTHNLGRKVE